MAPGCQQQEWVARGSNSSLRQFPPLLAGSGDVFFPRYLSSLFESQSPNATLSGNASLTLLPHWALEVLQPWSFRNSFGTHALVGEFSPHRVLLHRAPKKKKGIYSDTAGFRSSFLNPHFSETASKDFSVGHVEILRALANANSVTHLPLSPECRVVKFWR